MTRSLLLTCFAVLSNALVLRAQLVQTCLNVDLGAGEFLSGMAQDPSGGFFLVGTIWPDGTASHAEIARIDPAGGLIEGMRSVHDTEQEGLNAVARTSDNGFVAGGQWQAGILTSMLMVKFNGEGELLWSWSVGEQGTGSTYALAVAAAFDGEILAAGARSDLSAHHAPFVVEFDDEGVLNWKFAYQFQGNASGDATGIIRLPDGGSVVSGYHNGEDNSAVHGWMMRLDSTGHVAWSRTTQPGARVDAVMAAPDGGFVFAGSLEGQLGMGGYYDALVVKVNADGQFVWDLVVGTDDTEYANTITRTIDGGYVVGGTFVSGGGDQQAYLIKLDFSGQLLWTRRIGQSGSSKACFVVRPTLSNGLALGVRTSDGPEADMGLVLTDGLGMPCPLCGVDSAGDVMHGITLTDFAVTPVDLAETSPHPLAFAPTGTSSILCGGVGIAEPLEDKGAVRIVPQPVGPSAQIHFQGFRTADEPVTFILSDALGQQVLALPLRSNPTAFDRGGLPSGVYQYHLRSGSSVLRTGTVVME